MVYVIHVCWQLVSSSIFSCSQAVSKPLWLDALISQIYSWNEILHVSDSSSVHHQEFFTVHTAMVYFIQVCWQLVSRSIFSCSQAVSKPVWHIPLLCVQWKTPDDGQRNWPKHVEFYSKKKFEKLVHIDGFIIRNLTRCTVTWTSKVVRCTTVIFQLANREPARNNRCGLLPWKGWTSVFYMFQHLLGRDEGACSNFKQKWIELYHRIYRRTLMNAYADKKYKQLNIVKLKWTVGD
jgi:hypothetical protein